MGAKSIVKINVRGGIIPMGEFKYIIQALKTTNVEMVELGERQNIYLKIEKDKQAELEEIFRMGSIDFEIDTNKFPNIISAYATVDIFSTHQWMEEGLYRDILNSFVFKPELKINIADNTQALTPLYTGNLNFIPSSHLNFFYLYINHPKLGNSLQRWPKLIYSTDIAQLSKTLEQYLLKESIGSFSSFIKNIDKSLKLNTLEIDEPLSTPRLRFPYYEGMNKVGENHWLGIFRRNNNFSLPLLDDIYTLCSNKNIAQINLTPRRSILIKNIKEIDRIDWEKLLSNHGINSRHSSLELNWQLADLNPESIRIKNELVKDFDRQDIRTYGISFAIYNRKPLDISSSIIIKKRPSIIPFWGFLKHLTVYDILYAPDFSLNSEIHLTYTSNVSWNGLGVNLQDLCGKYYKQLSQANTTKPIVKVTVATPIEDNTYQCLHCLSLYDEKYGEPENDIAAGTSFLSLRDDYCCPLCESPKADFIKNNSKIYVS